MKTNEFRELMISLLEMQISYITEDEGYESSRYLQGQEVGLRIAISKLKMAAFLTEKVCK